MPIYLVLAIFKIVSEEMQILKYLKETVWPRVEDGTVDFEEMLLLRLSQDITKQTSQIRVPDFVEGLQELIPEFDVYKQIFVRLKQRKSQHSETQTPGLVNRAILSEWVKYALHLNLSDEVVRNQIVSLIFESAANIEPTFADYEHLLGEKK